MAQFFKNKIIGKLSEKPIIIKKITPQPKIETIIPIVEEEFLKEEIQTSVETVIITEETITVSNDTVNDSFDTVNDSFDTVITPEEPETPLEEPKPKKSRKKKSE